MRCRVRTAPDVRPLVAWQLDIYMYGIDRPPEIPDVVVRWRPHGGGAVQPELDTEGYRFLGRAPGGRPGSPAAVGCQPDG